MDDCPAVAAAPARPPPVLFSPCHCVEITGGPAVVRCPICGHSYHADAPELLLVALASRLTDRPLFESEGGAASAEDA